MINFCRAWPKFILLSALILLGAIQNNPQETALSVAVMPEIKRLYNGEALFDQILIEVAAFHEAQAKNAVLRPLLFMRYIVKKGETLFMISARLTIPISTLASLNSLKNPEVQPGMELIIPSQPGLFVPLDASGNSNLGQRLEGKPATQVSFLRANARQLFLFYPDEDFTPAERKSFLVKTFRIPLATYRVTSRFGVRSDPFTGKPSHHNGIDLAAPTGTKIVAIAEGIIREVGFEISYGNYVIIDHADGWRSLYAHMHTVNARRGSAIAAGAPIGTLGSTGRSTGPHLHLAIYQNGKARNPAPLLGIN
jgi:murein DD-endopeptidase MepM/ murein hydrolase activator NlpD